MSQAWREIPKLDSLDFDTLVEHVANMESRTPGDILKFISTRMSLQAGLELLGVPLLVTGPFHSERSRAEPLLQAFESYLIDNGCNIPELMWEPIGLTIFDPYLNEDAHITAANNEKRRQKV